MTAKGFTLIEILVASVILFVAISLGVLSFQTSTKAIRSADSSVKMLSVIPFVLNDIEQRLRNAPIQDYTEQGQFMGVLYGWHAKPTKVAPPKERFHPNSKDFVKYADRFVLYSIQLNITLDNKTQSFVYRKLGWSPLMETSQGDLNET